MSSFARSNTDSNASNNEDKRDKSTAVRRLEPGPPLLDDVARVSGGTMHMCILSHKVESTAHNDLKERLNDTTSVLEKKTFYVTPEIDLAALTIKHI